jgi:hypothetical protein
MLDKRTDGSSSMPADHGTIEGVGNADTPPETGGDLPF